MPPKFIMEHEYLYHVGSHSTLLSYQFPKQPLHLIFFHFSLSHGLFKICLQQMHAAFPYTERRLWKAKRIQYPAILRNLAEFH